MATTVAKTAPIDSDATDAALRANPADPTRSFVFGTAKTADVHMFTGDGVVVAFFDDGETNNADIRLVTLAAKRSDAFQETS